jgi:type I restriction enzyme S subunit
MRPYLRVANVLEDRIDISDVKRMNFTPREFEVYVLREGDILLNEGQSLELVGRPAMYRNEVPDCCFQNTLVRFRSRDAINPHYALIVFRAYLHDGQFAKIAKITTNLAHLGTDRFAQLQFPLPPQVEQSEIVGEVKKKLTAANRLAIKLDQHIPRARVTRQSLLEEAFTGRLVPQDPTDEPAALLLERIRAARENETQKPKVKRMPKTGFEISASGPRDLLAVLKENGGGMTPEELFHASGHSQDSVDQFFAELRALTSPPVKIVEERKAGGRIVLRAMP